MFRNLMVITGFLVTTACYVAAVVFVFKGKLDSATFFMTLGIAVKLSESKRK